MIDVNVLMDKVDAITVAQNIGMDIKRKGRYNFILCPGHTKVLGYPDTNASNCVLTEKGYHCFGCNVTKNLFTMVMEFCGVDFVQALNIVAEIAGVDASKGTTIYVQKLPLSSEQLKVIGLKSEDNYIFVNKFKTDETEDLRSRLLFNDEILLTSNVKCWSLLELYSSKRNLFNRYIVRKAKDAIKEYDRLIDMYCHRDGDGIMEVYALLNENGEIPQEVLSGLKNALLKRKSEAQNILDTYQSKVSK